MRFPISNFRSGFIPIIALLSLPTSVLAEDLMYTGDFSKQDSTEAMRAGRGTERQLVFLNFYNESNSQEYQHLENAVGDAVYSATIRKYTYSRIDKAIWQRYVSASHFKPADFFDRGKIQSVGDAIPADGIVFGKFAVTPEGIRISARVLAVFSHEIIADAETVLPLSKDISKELQSFSESLAKQVAELFVPSDRGAIWRSALLPGWGQFYKRRPTAGKIYIGAVGTGFAFSLFSLVMWQTSYSRYRNYNPDHVITPQGGTELVDPVDAQAQFDRYASQAQTWQNITLVSIGVTLAVYLWQIVDAWIFDTRHAQLGKRLAAEVSEGTFLILGGTTRPSVNENQVPNSISGQYSLGLGVSF
jgi:TM2 domain-containing membrane protein YozV